MGGEIFDMFVLVQIVEKNQIEFHTKVLSGNNKGKILVSVFLLFKRKSQEMCIFMHTCP